MWCMLLCLLGGFFSFQPDYDEWGVRSVMKHRPSLGNFLQKLLATLRQVKHQQLEISNTNKFQNYLYFPNLQKCNAYQKSKLSSSIISISCSIEIIIVMIIVIINSIIQSFTLDPTNLAAYTEVVSLQCEASNHQPIIAIITTVI